MGVGVRIISPLHLAKSVHEFGYEYDLTCKCLADSKFALINSDKSAERLIFTHATDIHTA